MSEDPTKVLTNSVSDSLGVLNSITDYRGLSLAIFGALVAISGQVLK